MDMATGALTFRLANGEWLVRRDSGELEHCVAQTDISHPAKSVSIDEKGCIPAHGGNERELTALLGVSSLQSVGDWSAASEFASAISSLEKGIAGEKSIETLLDILETGTAARNRMRADLVSSPRWDKVRRDLFARLKGGKKSDDLRESVERFARIIGSDDGPMAIRRSLGKLRRKLAPAAEVPTRDTSRRDERFGIAMGLGTTIRHRLIPELAMGLDVSWRPCDYFALGIGTIVTSEKTVKVVSRPDGSRVYQPYDGLQVMPNGVVKVSPWGSGFSFVAGGAAKLFDTGSVKRDPYGRPVAIARTNAMEPIAAAGYTVDPPGPVEFDTLFFVPTSMDGFQAVVMAKLRHFPL